MTSKSVDPELIDYKFGELSRIIGKMDKKMDLFITESVKSRGHFQECMVQVKLNVTKNYMRIQSGQELTAKNSQSLEDHITEHIAERNKTLGAAGGLGAFLGSISSFIIGALSK